MHPDKKFDYALPHADILRLMNTMASRHNGGLAAAEGRARARGGEDAGSWLAAASETLGMGVQDSCE